MAENFLKIAQDTVLSTEGVSGLVFLGIIPIPKDKALDLDVYISVEYGVNIPDVAWNVQENIKKNLSILPDLVLGRINIHVESIHFKEKEIYE